MPSSPLNATVGMDELSDEDKLVITRARKIQRFFSQPMTVAQVFTGLEGSYVSLKETIHGVKEILEGKRNAIREDLFYMAGNIDEVVQRYKG